MIYFKGEAKMNNKRLTLVRYPEIKKWRLERDHIQFYPRCKILFNEKYECAGIGHKFIMISDLIDALSYLKATYGDGEIYLLRSEKGNEFTEYMSGVMCHSESVDKDCTEYRGLYCLLVDRE